MCLIFRHSPPALQHTWSNCPQACGCPLEKSFLAWPLTNFASPPLPRHLQTSGPAATHFPIPEVTMDNIVHTALTHIEFYGNFINSDSLLDLMFHCPICHTNWSPTPVFITDVLSSVLKSFHPFTHSPLTQSTVSTLNLHSSVDSEGFTPSDHIKRIMLHCSSMVQVDSGAAMLYKYELWRRLILLDCHDPY